MSTSLQSARMSGLCVPSQAGQPDSTLLRGVRLPLPYTALAYPHRETLSLQHGNKALCSVSS